LSRVRLSSVTADLLHRRAGAFCQANAGHGQHHKRSNDFLYHIKTSLSKRRCKGGSPSILERVKQGQALFIEPSGFDLVWV
jgi:hypothetical protein